MEKSAAELPAGGPSQTKSPRSLLLQGFQGLGVRLISSFWPFAFLRAPLTQSQCWQVKSSLHKDPLTQLPVPLSPGALRPRAVTLPQEATGGFCPVNPCSQPSPVTAAGKYCKRGCLLAAVAAGHCQESSSVTQEQPHKGQGRRLRGEEQLEKGTIRKSVKVCRMLPSHYPERAHPWTLHTVLGANLWDLLMGK